MQKINSGETLEEGDYYTMLDYMEDFVEDGEASDGSYEAGQELGQEYPYIMVFAIKLDNVPEEISTDPRYEDVCERFLRIMDN